jgi:hypothetical protein
MTGTVLDWTKTGSAGPSEPCVICHRPAICRSPGGKPCHKVCAERWAAEHATTTGGPALGRAA